MSDPTSLPATARQRTSPISLIVFGVGGNCRPPETAHDCHIFVTRKTTQGSPTPCDKWCDKCRAHGKCGMDFDPRDFDSRDDDRFNTRGSKDRSNDDGDREDDLRLPEFVHAIAMRTTRETWAAVQATRGSPMTSTTAICAMTHAGPIETVSRQTARSIRVSRSRATCICRAGWGARSYATATASTHYAGRRRARWQLSARFE